MWPLRIIKKTLTPNQSKISIEISKLDATIDYAQIDRRLEEITE
jgi:hypothetical protein